MAQVHQVLVLGKRARHFIIQAAEFDLIGAAQVSAAEKGDRDVEFEILGFVPEVAPEMERLQDF